MVEESRRLSREGVLFGIVAGTIFLVMQIIVAALSGMPPLAPLRLFASVLLGRIALEAVTTGAALFFGIVVHLILSATYGLIYGVINGRLSTNSQRQTGRQAWLGLLFGLLLWALNFQILARLLYPWFLLVPQFPQVMIHAIFYGLPLGLMFASAERRMRVAGPAGVTR